VKLEDLHKPAIPVAYGTLILDVVGHLGVARADLLKDQGISTELLENPDARLSMLQANNLLYRALRLSGNPALGYEIGLHSSLTSHGFIGFGLMCHSTLRDSVTFGSKFLQLRLPNLRLRISSEGDFGIIEVVEAIPSGTLRQCMIDLFMVGLWRMARYFAADLAQPDAIELWFDRPEPSYHQQYRSRLPAMRFGMSANQMRIPQAFLDLPLQTANPVTAQLVTQQCQQELSRLGYDKDFAQQVRALLINRNSAYPNLDELAAALSMSSRTIKRRLLEHDLSFQLLLDDVRRRDSMQLLADPTLSIEEISHRIGYCDPANFTRAFRKWTGSAPRNHRLRMQPSSSG